MKDMNLEKTTKHYFKKLKIITFKSELFYNMKKSLFITAIILFSVLANAQPPSGKAKSGTVYGAKTNADNAILASEIPTLLKTKDTISAKFKAKVVDACAQKGCWMSLQINDSTTAFVKMKDYAFFVPLDIIGKTVVLDGKTYMKTTSVSELKHYAEDAKKTQAEIDAITQPKSEVRVMANGILVVN